MHVREKAVPVLLLERLEGFGIVRVLGKHPEQAPVERIVAGAAAQTVLIVDSRSLELCYVHFLTRNHAMGQLRTCFAILYHQPDTKPASPLAHGQAEA